MSEFLEWDWVYCIGVDGPKDATAWGEAMKYFRVRAENCLIVGDSPSSDIRPCLELGTPPRNTVLVDGLTWTVHISTLPDEVWQIGRLDQLPWLGHGEVLSLRRF